MARLRGIVYAGYYGHWLGSPDDDQAAQEQANADNPVFRAIGFTLPLARQRAGTPDDPSIAEYTANDLPPSVFVAEDAIPDAVEVVVIGSGAGGAVAAANLAAQGYEVLVIEATRTARSRPRLTATSSCFRAARWADRPSSTTASHEIDRRLGRNNGTRMLGAWQAYRAGSVDPMDARATSGWFRKNWGAKHEDNRCLSCGYCNTGCPYGRKRAMPESFLHDAVLQPGAGGRKAKILAGAQVLEIGWGPRADDGRRVANAVQVLFPDGRGKRIGVTKGVVVAAGTIASTNILAQSGIRGTGKGVSLNIACPVPALMPDPVLAWDEDQMATYIDRGDFLIESHFQPPMSMATLV